MNKKGSRYRRLMEIRSRNSRRQHGLDPKASFTLTTIRGEWELTYKDWIIFGETPSKMTIHKPETSKRIFD